MDLGFISRASVGRGNRLVYHHENLSAESVADMHDLVARGPLLNVETLTEQDLVKLCGIFAAEAKRLHDEAEIEQIKNKIAAQPLEAAKAAATALALGPTEVKRDAESREQ
jgi:hypothetical protein